MSLPRFSVENHVLVNMLMIVILVAGGCFAFGLVREMFPESRPNKLMITAMYPGIQPDEIEKAITIKVEEAVRDIEGIDKVDSLVAEGITTTSLTLLNEVKDVDALLQEVKTEIDALADLPAEMEELTVKKFEPQLPVISVAIFGDGDEAALKQAARDLRDDLLLLPGISNIEINGARDDEISVEVRPERLLEYDITFDEVAEAIRLTNLDVSGGQLKGSRTSVSVRTLGEQMRGEDLLGIVVRSEPDGRKIKLADVAVVRDDFVDTDLESYFNGQPAVHCVVYKNKSQDAIQIATLVRAYVKGKLNEPFDPFGFVAAYEAPWYTKPFKLAGAGALRLLTKAGGRPDPQQTYDQSRNDPFAHPFHVALHTNMARFIEGRLDLLTRNGKMGLVLVLISLNLFLNWRIAFWASVGLVVSFLGTFVVMWMLGATVNLLSMFGLIIVLGIIVDDAIVIGENIYRHVEEGMPPREAAIYAAEEVMWPVIIAVATTVGAFAPLFFIRGQIGDFMGQLPIVVISALSISLIEALVILPAHLAHLPSKAEHDRRTAQRRERRWLAAAMRAFGRFQDRVMHGVLLRIYEKFLRFTMRWRYVTVVAAMATWGVAAGLVAGGIVEATFIQKMDSESLVCQLEMPVGTTADNTRRQLAQIGEFVLQTPEVVNVQTFVSRVYDLAGAGSMGTNDQPHLGQIIIELKAADERERDRQRSSEEILVGFRRFTQQLAGVNSITWDSLSGGPGGRDIEIKVSGRKFDNIAAVADQLKAELATFQGVFDLDDDYDRGKREVQLRLLESARPTGITVGTLGNHVRSAMYGRESRRITRNREDVRIMVRYPESFRTDVYNLEAMWIPTAALRGQRGWVPLREVAELTESLSYTTIHRSRQQRSMTVFGHVDQETAESSAILNALRTAFDERIGPRYPDVQIEFLGKAEEMKKSFGSLKVAMPVALLLIYMMLAGLFRSYVQPMIVMSAIPFGFVGAVVGHLVTNNPMTILSAIGMVALTGILVNDSLVLVDFINSRVRAGMDLFEASVEGAKLRLRAILLTTVTTVAGLTPLMFETSFQAKFLIPMAVTLTFGLLFATGLTLILVPSLNMIFFDVVHRRWLPSTPFSRDSKALRRGALPSEASSNPPLTKGGRGG